MKLVLGSPLLSVAIAVQDYGEDLDPEFSGKVVLRSSLTAWCRGACGAAQW